MVDVAEVLLSIQLAMFTWLIAIERRLSRIEGYLMKIYNGVRDNSKREPFRMVG